MNVQFTSLPSSLPVDIRQRVSGLLGDAITGAQLAAFIRREYPAFDFRSLPSIGIESGALKRFVASYLRDVLEPSGQAGGDILYRIIRYGNVTDETPSLWRAFTSGQSHERLFWSPRTSKLCAAAEPTSQTDVAIEGISQAEYGAIARDFLSLPRAQLSPSTVQALLGIPSYADWTAALKQSAPHAFGYWNKYRRETILNRLNDRLIAIGLTNEAIASCRIQLEASQTAHWRAKPHASANLTKAVGEAPSVDRTATAPPRRIVGATTAKADDTERLRKALCAAIARLPESDLRQIRLPFGVVFDALQLIED